MRIYAKGVRGDEAPRGLPVGAAPVQKHVTRKVQDPHAAGQVVLDPAVGERLLAGLPPQLRYVHPAVPVKGNVRGTLDVIPHVEELAVPGEDLDPVVLAVGHEDPVVGRDPDAVRQAKLAGPRPGLAPGLDERPIGGEAVHPGVAVPVADIQLSIGGDGYIGRPVERRPAVLDAAVALSVIAGVRGHAGGADQHHLRPLGRKFAHCVVAVVHGVHHVVRPDGDPVRARGEDVLAPGAEKMTLPVVDDDPGVLPGHQIHVVPGVDRHPVHVLVDIPRRQLLPPFDDLEFWDHFH